MPSEARSTLGVGTTLNIRDWVLFGHIAAFSRIGFKPVEAHFALSSLLHITSNGTSVHYVPTSRIHTSDTALQIHALLYSVKSYARLDFPFLIPSCSFLVRLLYSE
jgi:hypothetical protein